MWTARPPAVFRRRGHILHLKCFAFWCCMRTGGRGISAPRVHNTLTRTLFILKFALTVPAPWPDDLLLVSFHACWSLRGPTCLFFFLAIVLRATSFGGKGKPENGNSGQSVTNVTSASRNRTYASISLSSTDKQTFRVQVRIEPISLISPTRMYIIETNRSRAESSEYITGS